MLDWIEKSIQLQQSSEAFVMVVIGQVKGSSPREMGTRMLVTLTDSFFTIGGGNLEHQSIQIARAMLNSDQANQYKRFSLAAGLGQCCGGVVSVLFEKITQETAWLKDLNQFTQRHTECVQVTSLQGGQTMPRLFVSKNTVFPSLVEKQYPQLAKIAREHLDQAEMPKIQTVSLSRGQHLVLFEKMQSKQPHLYVFGAGHVGNALMHVLDHQLFTITWIDTRDDQFSKDFTSGIQMICTDIPHAMIAEAPQNSYFLVMTHDHSLDLLLTEHILKRNDFSYFGMIGSLTKRERFKHRLSARGISQQSINKMVCPIGIDGIQSKKPTAIAVSVAAQLLQQLEVSASKGQPCFTEEKIQNEK